MLKLPKKTPKNDLEWQLVFRELERAATGQGSGGADVYNVTENITQVIGSQHEHQYGTAPPTSGTYSRGAIVWNTAPLAGQAIPTPGDWSFSDNFASGTALSSSWGVISGTWSVTGGEAKSGTAADCIALVQGYECGRGATVEVYRASGLAYAGVVACMDVAGNGYVLTTHGISPYIRLYTRQGGAETQIASYVSAGTVHGLRLVIAGDTLTGYMNQSGVWTQVLQVVDMTFTSGKPGIWTSITNGYVDNFAASYTLSTVSGVPYIGWVCTTAGTPGTWRPFGAIA